jgi:hypothetical protein
MSSLGNLGGPAASAPTPGSATPARYRSDEWPPVPRARKIWNAVFWTLCFIGLALIVVPLVWLAGGIVVRAVPHFQFSVLTTNTTGTGGGHPRHALHHRRGGDRRRRRQLADRGLPG